MSSTIKERADLCTAAFRSLPSRLKDDAMMQGEADQRFDTEISNEYDRFQLWAHDVGAWDGTLDDALVSSSSLRGLTVSLLDELHDQLMEPEGGLLEEMKDIVDNLISLEPALGSPAPLDDLHPKEPKGGHEMVETRIRTSGLAITTQNSRFLTGKPDLDIVLVAGFTEASPLMGNPQAEHTPLHLDWLERSLPEILEENGIYSRVLTYNYDLPPQFQPSSTGVSQYDFVEFFTRITNNLVQELNNARLGDPTRPLFFVGQGQGVTITKQTAVTLIQEGLSVNNDRPICGCMFLDGSPMVESVANVQSFLGIDLFHQLPDKVQAKLLQEALLIQAQTSQFKSLVEQQGIEILTMKINRGDLIMTGSATDPNEDLNHDWTISLDLSVREAVLPIAHKIASIAGRSISDREEGLETGLTDGTSSRSALIVGNQSEDPFAMLVAYDTAILVNDSSTTTPSVWSSIIEIVRDCVDIVIAYRDDVDIQLYKYESTSFSVTEGAKASRILAGVSPAGVSWDLDAQLRRYVRKYIASDFSVLPGGMLRPCNMIILTEQAPDQDPTSLLNALANLIVQSSHLPSGQLRLCVQFVLLGKDLEADEFFKQFDYIAAMNRSSSQEVSNKSLSRKWRTKNIKVAPTFRLSGKYRSNAEICKRILLGAISPRFAATAFSIKETFLPGSSQEIEDGASTSAGSDFAGQSEAQWSGFAASTAPSTVDASISEDISLCLPAPPQEALGPEHLSLVVPAPIDVSASGDFAPSILTKPRRHSGPAREVGQETIRNTNYEEASSRSREASRELATLSSRRDALSIGSRDYILDLADPDRPSESSKRAQKHPATFQCTLCPKRFTRAYNLRSHLRTHTDERPFVCTVCGKAFSRQHDRKRHESLHSGEKKFVCSGELAVGGRWGCGRRFARADAIGRHFRSEAGRVCIKPLLEEEARDRQFRAQIESAIGAPTEFTPDDGVQGPNAQSRGFTLPVALLAQYPALQNINWSQEQPISSGGREDHLESDMSDMSDGPTFRGQGDGDSQFYDDEGDIVM